jgi:hypothetical protein
VCATSKETSDTVLFTSYPSRRCPPDLLRSVRIWEAARATSAATSFFDPISIGRYRETFNDGATGANNPVRHLWAEAADKWRGLPLDESIRCLVSIGTGVPAVKSYGDSMKDVARTLLKLATDTERTAEIFSREHAALTSDHRYFRFNVSKGLENIMLEEYKQRNSIAAATRAYLSSQTVLTQLELCAEMLKDQSGTSMSFTSKAS